LSVLESDCCMSPSLLSNFCRATFRANPAYELVLREHLLPAEQAILAGLPSDADVYAILRPRTAGLNVQTICADTAYLFRVLHTGGCLPLDVRMRLGNQCNAAIAALVFDRILEIEVAGAFVSGATALRLVSEGSASFVALDRIGQLSLDAVRYGQALSLPESSTLSARLYFYNRLPFSSHWQRTLPSAKAVAQYLGIKPGGQNCRLLYRSWVETSPVMGRWLSWRSIFAVADTSHPYKLYVSPHTAYLCEALEAVLAVFTEMRVPAFKVGKDALSLLRPDKLVAYFAQFQDVHEVAERLHAKLMGMPAHSVPFTAALDAQGLLSWGVDPPRSEYLLARHGMSWRRWITDRLAIALVSAQQAPAKGLEPWQFALLRLEAAGISTTTWTQKEELWERDHEPGG
jgi:hypothetical protein